MVDALLINPRVSVNEKYPPLSLICLAAYAEREGFTVDICDAAAYEMPDEEVLDKISQCNPMCVGLTFMTAQYSYALVLAGLIKKYFPKVFLITGGIHSNVVPEDTLKRMPFLDAIVIGEGEITLTELLSYLKSDKRENKSAIKGLAFIDKGKFVKTNSRPLITSLDILPIPAWNKLPIQRYKVSQPARRYELSEGIALTISSSRGCPHRCLFCCAHGVYGSGYRYRSPQLVVDEIEYLVRHFNVRHFFFVDEVLFQKRDHILTLAREIINRKLDICWAGNSRVNSPALDDEVIEYAIKAGCVRVDFGVETGSPKILKEIHKGITLPQIYKSHKEVQRHGLATTSLMMVGHPGESFEDVLASIRLIAYLESDYSAFGPSTPFPGTPLYKLAKDRGWLRSDDWSDYFITNSYRVMRNQYFDYQDIYRLNNFCNNIAYIFEELATIKRYKPEITHSFWSCARLFTRILTNRYRSVFHEDFTLRKRAEIIEMFLTKDAASERFEKLLAKLSINDLKKLRLPSNNIFDEIFKSKIIRHKRILVMPLTNMGGYFSFLRKMLNSPFISEIGLCTPKEVVIDEIFDISTSKLKALCRDNENVVRNIKKFGSNYNAIIIPCHTSKGEFYLKLLLKILILNHNTCPIYILALGSGGNVIEVKWISFLAEVFIRIKRITKSFFIEYIFSVVYSFRLARIAHRLSSFNRMATIPQDQNSVNKYLLQFENRK